VNCAAYFLIGQGHDHALDLPPVAEAQDISSVAARFSSGGCFETGVVAIGFEQQRGISQRPAAIDEGHVHERRDNPAHLALWVTDKVNEALAIFADLWRGSDRSVMPHLMKKPRNAAAGGIFLFLGPVVGALYGIGRGEPILWMLYGFGAGVVIAILVWLVDRRRG
jgi:hypothetical protein